jgi:capsid protein
LNKDERQEKDFVKGNLVDRMIKYFDPVRAHQRMRARAFMALAGAYVGASTSRRSLSGWSLQTQDADSAILPELATLRERSRDLIRNAPLAAGAIGTACNSVVGMGLKLQSRPDREVLGFSSDDEADRWETNTEREFRLWADSQICDIRKTLYFQDIQDLVFRQTLENGDVFILMARETVKECPYSLRLQLVEADRICNKDNVQDSETLVGGVEKEKTGAPKAYHILNHHPGELAL